MSNLRICPRCLYIPDMTTQGIVKCPFCLIQLDETELCHERRTIEEIRYIDNKYEQGDMFDKISWRYRIDHSSEEFMYRTTPIPGSKPIQQPSTPTLTTCPVCNGKLSTAATACPHCGQPMNQGKPVQAVQQAPAQPQNTQTGPRCPMCNSEHIEKIGSFDRVTSVMFWGLASSKIGKQYKCRSCGHKW